MRVLVTGARGKVGRATVPVLAAAGHEVVATDLFPPEYGPPSAVSYIRADLTDAGEAYALIGGASVGQNAHPGRFDAVVHAAAIPAPGFHAPHVVFGSNTLMTFNVVEACVRLGVPRLVNLSSESVTGIVFAERPLLPDYLPIDEEHPLRPQDPYALSKVVGEQLCEAAARRSDLGIVTIRPTWVQDAESYGRHLGPFLRDRTMRSAIGWSYVDASDLADLIRLAVECDLPGHVVLNAANPDTMGGRDLHTAWRTAFPDATTELRPVPRSDASGMTSAKATRLLGWHPTRSWRDYLTDDGQPR